MLILIDALFLKTSILGGVLHLAAESHADRSHNGSITFVKRIPNDEFAESPCLTSSTLK
jgi:hypothetical protein